MATEPTKTAAPKAAAAPAVDPIEEAKARAATAELDDDLDDDLNAVGNIGAPVGKPIACIARKKFYSEQGQIVEPGQTYYLQLYEGQNFPSDVLEPIDAKQAKDFRVAFKARRRERNEAKLLRERARESLLYAGVVATKGARPSQVEAPSK